MDGEIEAEGDTGNGRTKFRSFFSSLKQRAQSSLMCSSVNVIPIDQQHDVEPPSTPTSPQPEKSPETPQVVWRWFGVTDLRDPELDNPTNEPEEEPKKADKRVGDDRASSTGFDEGIDPDYVWEDNMWRKLAWMRCETRPAEFRLYLVEMIRYSASKGDLSSNSVYMRQLLWEYGLYDNYEKIAKELTKRQRRRSKFRVDRVAEELIIRLSTLEVGSNERWKTTVGMICDRLKKNMEPKPKVPKDELPKFFANKAARSSRDLKDAWSKFTTVDLTGYALVGSKEGVRLRKRLLVFLSLRPAVLVKLSLSHTGLDTPRFLEMLPHIANIPALQELDLRGNRLTKSVIKHFYPFLGKPGDRFRSGFRHLRWVYFNHNYNIHRLPSRFLSGLNRRWPTAEHRPNPREVSDCRATVSDFSKVENLQARILAKIERKECDDKKKRRKEPSKVRQARDWTYHEVMQNLAATDGSISSDSTISLASSSGSSVEDLQNEHAGANDAANRRRTDAAQLLRSSAAAGAAVAAAAALELQAVRRRARAAAAAAVARQIEPPRRDYPAEDVAAARAADQRPENVAADAAVPAPEQRRGNGVADIAAARAPEQRHDNVEADIAAEQRRVNGVADDAVLAPEQRPNNPAVAPAPAVNVNRIAANVNNADNDIGPNAQQAANIQNQNDNGNNAQGYVAVEFVHHDEVDDYDADDDTVFIIDDGRHAGNGEAIYDRDSLVAYYNEYFVNLSAPVNDLDDDIRSMDRVTEASYNRINGRVRDMIISSRRS